MHAWSAARSLISDQLLDMRNVAISLAGDFECLQEVEDLLLKYLGTIPSRSTFLALMDPSLHPVNPFAANLPSTNILASASIDNVDENFVLSVARKFPNRINFAPEARMKWQHLSEDEEHRAVVYMCFPIMNRWGHTQFPASSPPRNGPRNEPMDQSNVNSESMDAMIRSRVRQHHLFKNRVANVLAEVPFLSLPRNSYA